MQQRQQRFGEWLQALNLAEAGAIEAALKEQELHPDYLGEILIRRRVISESVRDGILRLQKLLGTSTRLDEMEISAETLQTVSPRLAHAYSVFPVLQVGQCLVVATAQPEDTGWKDALQASTGLHIYPLSFRASDIESALATFYTTRQARAATGLDWISDQVPDPGPRLTFVGSGDALGSGARNQTCLHVRSKEATFLIDCGPSSLTALKQMDLALEDLDGALLTHAHGDHFGGLPFVLLEQLTQQRRRPFWIMGPQHLLDHFQAFKEMCYPGLFQICPYDIRYLPIEDEPRSIPGTSIMVYPFAMDHMSSRLCLGYQVHLAEEKILAYTGDTAWGEHIVNLARDTDLFVCECSFYQHPAPDLIKHISYLEIQAHREQLKTRRLVLTHMGEEMLARASDVSCDTAFDGLVIDL
jgi:ribonuclease BN (tRNA processing enzyme)